MVAQSIVPLNQDNAVSVVAALKMLVRRLRDEQMVDGQDYGKIPGTNDKPTLLLPGMEKLMRALNVVPQYTERRVIVDYDKPLFHYEYECRLIDVETGLAVPGGLAIGIATSFESKWYWRWVSENRVPAKYDKAGLEQRNGAIREPNFAVNKKETTGKYGKPAEYWKRFEDAIEDGTANAVKMPKKDGGMMDGWEIGSIEYRIPNPDIFDQINTICKIAQKRALSSAIKGAAAVSEFFTVDLDDRDENTITVIPEIVEDKSEPKAEPITPTNITPINDFSNAKSAKRRLPVDGSAALKPEPVALNAWASKETIAEFGGDCRDATGADNLQPSEVARLGLGETNDTQFHNYKLWNETYATKQAAIDAIKSAFEAEMSAKPATPKEQPSMVEQELFPPPTDLSKIGF